MSIPVELCISIYEKLFWKEFRYPNTFICQLAYINKKKCSK